MIYMPKFGRGAEGAQNPSKSTPAKIVTIINYCVSVNSNEFTLSRGVPPNQGICDRQDTEKRYLADRQATCKG